MIKKAIVTMNEDGHFVAAQIDNREKSISIVKSVYDGELWEDYLEDALDDCDLKEEDLMVCPLNRFDQFLSQFETRGVIEVVEITE
jgi:hypothetical protein